jgi:lipid-A-disaccharide synthase
VFLIAGEPSGDRLGAALMTGLQTLRPDVAMRGIGGPEMEACGLSSLFPMSDLSVMGLAEVLPRLPALLRRRDEAARAVVSMAPDALVTIDSPDFCLRVAARARAASPRLKVVHYVAPSVWAWRPGRAARMARSVDHVLALLPFEPPYMEAAGMGCDFVGHPVAEEPLASPEDSARFRAALPGPDAAPVVLVLPGSRSGEVARLGRTFGEALNALPSDARAVVPTVPHVSRQVRDAVARWPRSATVVEGSEKQAAFAAADVALAASGTVSLELAANAVPMVIAYDMNWLSRKLLARMLRVDTVTLVNLVSETRAVPEFLGDQCRPGPIGAALARLLADATQRTRQRDAMVSTMNRLGRGGEAPGLRAARVVLRVAGGGTEPPSPPEVERI